MVNALIGKLRVIVRGAVVAGVVEVVVVPFGFTVMPVVMAAEAAVGVVATTLIGVADVVETEPVLAAAAPTAICWRVARVANQDI